MLGENYLRNVATVTVQYTFKSQAGSKMSAKKAFRQCLILSSRIDCLPRRLLPSFGTRKDLGYNNTRTRCGMIVSTVSGRRHYDASKFTFLCASLSYCQLKKANTIIHHLILNRLLKSQRDRDFTQFMISKN
jgi:hypothetical protein